MCFSQLLSCFNFCVQHLDWNMLQNKTATLCHKVTFLSNFFNCLCPIPCPFLGFSRVTFWRGWAQEEGHPLWGSADEEQGELRGHANTQVWDTSQTITREGADKIQEREWAATAGCVKNLWGWEQLRFSGTFVVFIWICKRLTNSFSLYVAVKNIYGDTWEEWVPIWNQDVRHQ